MKERGILFSAPMVRALLAGTKTQTRRVVDPKLYIEVEDGAGYTRAVEQDGPAFAAAAMEYARCPHGGPGDRLWDSINGKKAPWASNPWCWAVSFRRVQP